MAGYHLLPVNGEAPAEPFGQAQAKACGDISESRGHG